MSFETLLVERLADAPVAVVTVNRPDKLNALNDQVIAEMTACFKELKADASVRCIILTGAGRAFVAGADIAELKDLTPEQAEETARRGHAMMAAIEAEPTPVIAAINGFALGGGCELALACHIRLASEKAKLGLPEVTLGLLPGYGGTQRLSRLVGTGHALELICSGDMVGAARAGEIGLVNRVLPPEELMPAATTLAKTIASRGPRAVALALNAVTNGHDLPLNDGLAIEIGAFGQVFTTQDAREGTSAFLEKREAQFKGE